MTKEIFLQLVLAVFLGALIGLERELRKKGAGIRTYASVCLGACLLTIVSLNLFSLLETKQNVRFDVSGLIQAIAIGMGFIGAGVIFRQPAGIVGLTTAASLWVTAAIGIAIAIGLYSIALFTTLLIIFILIVLGFLEKEYIEK